MGASRSIAACPCGEPPNELSNELLNDQSLSKSSSKRCKMSNECPAESQSKRLDAPSGCPHSASKQKALARKEHSHGPRAFVTQPAPEFTANAVMPDGSFKSINLADYKGKYVILYFWPQDFSFVCPSEILAFDKAVEEFRAKNVEVLGISVDSVHVHNAWRNTPTSKGGIGEVHHPLVSDSTCMISCMYNVLVEDGVALRGLFLVDREGILRHQIVNDMPLGRSVDEAIRMVDALQFFEENGEVCPANWKKGEKAMKPTPEGVAGYLASN